MSKHIRVIGLSSHIDENMINGGIDWLKQQGFEVSVADQVFEKHYQSAGTIEQKIDALHEAYSDNNVDAIVISCGGNGAIHLLEYIDFDLIKNNPKPICGFSDTTIILNAINKQTGQTTLHGPTLTQIQRPIPDIQRKQFLKALNNEWPALSWESCVVENAHSTSGVLVGGNLSVFQTLLGTQYMPDHEDMILFLEDVGDEMSRYDRMLAHLKQVGVLNKAKAILFGDFHAANNSARVPFGKDIAQVVKDNTQGLDIPIVQNCPFGHRGQLYPLPIGQRCHLNFEENNVILSFGDE